MVTIRFKIKCTFGFDIRVRVRFKELVRFRFWNRFSFGLKVWISVSVRVALG